MTTSDPHRSIVVRADWDDEARVWVATSTEIDGLAIEADTLEALGDKVGGAVLDLIEMNGLEISTDAPVYIVAERTVRLSRAA